MKRGVWLFAIVFMVAAFLVYQEVTSVGWPNIVKVGSQAPDFAIKDKDGRETHLTDLHGKLVLLNFFKSDCLPCIEEMPGLQNLYDRLNSRDFQMMIIDGDATWNGADALYQKLHLSLPTYLDPGSQVFRKYNLTGTPETFLISSKGYVLKHYIGALEWSDARLSATLNKWIEERE